MANRLAVKDFLRTPTNALLNLDHPEADGFLFTGLEP